MSNKKLKLEEKIFCVICIISFITIYLSEYISKFLHVEQRFVLLAGVIFLCFSGVVLLLSLLFPLISKLLKEPSKCIKYYMEGSIKSILYFFPFLLMLGIFYLSAFYISIPFAQYIGKSLKINADYLCIIFIILIGGIINFGNYI